MSSTDDGLPQVDQIWHMGAHGDGSCVRWKCSAIHPAGKSQPQTFVFRALKHNSDEIDYSIGPQAVTLTDIRRGTTDLHGPEVADDEELIAFMSPAASRVTVQPLVLPRGVKAEDAQAVLTPILTAMLDKIGTEGLDAVQRRLKRLELAGWDVSPGAGRVDAEAFDRGMKAAWESEEGKALLADAKAAGYSEGEHAGIAAGERAAVDEFKREREMHPNWPAAAALLSGEACIAMSVLDPKHGPTHRLMLFDLSLEDDAKGRVRETGPLPEGIVRRMFREAMIASDFAAATDTASYARGVTDGKAAALALAERSPTFPIEEALRGDLSNPRIAIIGRDFESWCILTRMAGSRLGQCALYDSEGEMPREIVQGALTEALSAFDEQLGRVLAGWPGGILNSVNSIPGNGRPIAKHAGIGYPYGSRTPRVDPDREEAARIVTDRAGITEPEPIASPAELQAYGGLPKPSMAELRAAIRTCIRYSHGNSLASGWWPEVKEGLPRVGKMTHSGQRNFGELLCLIHSEISEALEGYRKNKDDDHLPQYKNFTVELADALHRIFDLAGAMRASLAEAYVDKGEYNLVREDHKLENRQKKGGKTF